CIEEGVLNFLTAHGFDIAQIEANHPGGAHGYRITDNGQSLVYLTDNELNPPYEKATEFDGFVEFSQGADVLIHDAQYTAEDMPEKHGWGHSLVSQVCDLAMAAQVKHLILYHHDPDRTDDELDKMQSLARDLLGKGPLKISCAAAYEGLELDLSLGASR
ncbi:MAG: hypothetical protein JSU61_08605, partial [Fidelibacterota bacterium]